MAGYLRSNGEDRELVTGPEAEWMTGMNDIYGPAGSTRGPGVTLGADHGRTNLAGDKYSYLNNSEKAGLGNTQWDQLTEAQQNYYKSDWGPKNLPVGPIGGFTLDPLDLASAPMMFKLAMLAAGGLSAGANGAFSSVSSAGGSTPWVSGYDLPMGADYFGATGAGSGFDFMSANDAATGWQSMLDPVSGGFDVNNMFPTGWESVSNGIDWASPTAMTDYLSQLSQFQSPLGTINPLGGGVPGSPSNSIFDQIKKMLSPGAPGSGGSGPGGGGAGGSGSGGAGDLMGLLSGLWSMFGRQGLDQSQIGELFNAGRDTFNSSRNPMQGYDMYAQKTRDQSRAADSARGIGMGGVSAGNENDAMRKFNIDWANTDLSRMATGAGAFANTANAATNASGQNFLQNQVGLNNAVTGVNQLNPGEWINSMFSQAPPAYGGSY